jgi:hypothetical protein
VFWGGCLVGLCVIGLWLRVCSALGRLLRLRNVHKEAVCTVLPLVQAFACLALCDQTGYCVEREGGVVVPSALARDS